MGLMILFGIDLMQHPTHEFSLIKEKDVHLLLVQFPLSKKWKELLANANKNDQMFLLVQLRQVFWS
jgi:hypothetical protein